MGIFTKKLLVAAVAGVAAMTASADDFTQKVFYSDFGEWGEADDVAWVFKNTQQGYGWKRMWQDSDKGPYGYDGPYALFKPGPTIPCDDWMISPSIRLEAGKYQLSFAAGSYGVVGQHTFNVCLGTSADDTSSFTQTIYAAKNQAIGISGGNKWENFTVVFDVATAGDYYLGFQGIGVDTEYSLGIDDVEILGEVAQGNKLKAVTDLKAAYAAGKINVSWTAPTETMGGTAVDASQITYIVKQTSGNSTTTLVENLADTSYEVAVNADGDYKYTVIPVYNNTEGVSATSDAVNVSLPVPEAVTDVKAVNTDLDVTLTWTAPAKMSDGSAVDAGKLTYKIMQSYNGGDAEFLTSGVKECKYEFKADKYGKYVFTVIPVANGKDGASAQSAPLDIVNVVVDPVTDLKAAFDAGAKTITVSWTAPAKLSDGTEIDAAEVSYKVEQILNSGSAVVLADDYKETSYTVNDAAEGNYEFFVTPRYAGKDGVADGSATVSVVYPKPEAVVDPVQEVEEDKVTLSWAAPAALDNGEAVNPENLTYVVKQSFTPLNSGVSEDTVLADALTATSYEVILENKGTYVFSVAAVYNGLEGAVYNFSPVEYGADGIVEVNSESAEASYYTLQGVKVDNPSNGMFIRVCGGSAKKVVK